MIIGGKYQILGRLGKGGMSEVYLARDTRLHMKWAIKRIHLRESYGGYLAESIISEANVLRKVRQENLVRITDIFRDKDSCFLVMEYVEGMSLSEYMQRKPAEAASHAPEWGIQLLHALAAMHGRTPPIIYRDMKPENIMVRPDGTVCLIDFGTAKQLRDKLGKDRLALGTREFAAPEQYHFHSDKRSDLYSLSKTLALVSRGKKIPLEWKKILKKGCAQDPADRYQTAEEFEKAIRYYRGRKYRIPILITLSLSVLITAAGLSYGSRIRRENREIADLYRSTIEAGNEALFREEYHDAESYYTKAITEVDGSNSEAYLCLLSLYRDLEKPEEGLKRINSYMDSDYGGSSHMDRLLYQCGLTAFYDMGSYGKAKSYFDKTDGALIPEATYFSNLSEILSSFESDPDSILKIIQKFRNYTEKCTEIETRASDDLLIAELCLTLSDSPEPAAATALLREAEECAKEVIKIIENQDLDTGYRDKSLEMLSAIYRLLGDKFPKNKNKYYGLSISYAETFLKESPLSERDMEVKLLSMARMYEDLGEYREASNCYYRCEDMQDVLDKDIYIGHLKLLSRASLFQEMKEVYETAVSINGIRQDLEFQKLEQMVKESSSSQKDVLEGEEEPGPTGNPADSNQDKKAREMELLMND
ncbi:MAG: serine/threonine protein kinase [Lachnospiraceae bacterium]|nr:serine/threonine protein kinase [Lachnospiraceae bacterium]